VAIARLLLARGASPQAASDDGTTALRLATDKGHTAVAELMQARPAPPAEE
jgi:ankyrin repeat protein